jgi:hypothetical protein
VRHRERRQPVAVALERVARRKLDEANLIRQPADDTPERRHQVDQPARAVHVERLLPPTEGERLEHPRQAQHMVGMKVRQKDLAEVDQADG